MAQMDSDKKDSGQPKPATPADLSAVAPPPMFVEKARSLGIEFDQGDLERLGQYLTHLLNANTRFNLTAITDPVEAWSRHILDSLTVVGPLVSLQATSVMDIGSGGGLPGIPLAIVLPDIHFTLVEATGKKARFLQAMITRLDLSNASVVCERAEIIGQDHKNHREHYDVVIARAVGRLPVLLELAIPLAKIGGHLLAMKGAQSAQEIDDAKQALHLLHSQVIESIVTPTGTIVVIEKVRKTPRAYPRQPGEPKRAPLH